MIRWLKSGHSRVRAGQLAQGIRQLSLVAIALALPRLGVELEAIGWWEQYQYLAYLLGFGWISGLSQAYLVRLGGLEKAEAERLSGQYFMTIVGISSGLLLLVWLLYRPFLQLFAGDAQLPGWLFFSVYLLSYWPGLVAEQIMLQRSRPARLLWYSILSNAALLTAVLLPLYMGYDFVSAMSWLAGIAFIKYGLTAWGLWGLLDLRRWSSAAYRGLWQLAAPLTIYASLNAINLSFDAWFVNFWYRGDHDVFAVFRYGTRELPLLAAATNGIVQAILPSLRSTAPDGRGGQSEGLLQLRRSSTRLMHLFYPTAALLILSSPWWWTWVFTDRLAESLPVFQLFMLLGISRMLFPVPVMAAQGLERDLIALGVIEICINALLSVLLALSYGLMGIVWATVLTYLIDKLLAVYWLKRKRGIAFGAYCHWPLWLGYSAGLVLVYFVAYSVS